MVDCGRFVSLGNGKGFTVEQSSNDHIRCDIREQWT